MLVRELRRRPITLNCKDVDEKEQEFVASIIKSSSVLEVETA